jgi:hypothetical protein
VHHVETGLALLMLPLEPGGSRPARRA